MALVAKLSEALAGLAIGRGWLRPERAEAIMRQGCERAVLAIGADDSERVGELVVHLRKTGQLTPALVLRAAVSGRRDLVEAALAELTALPLKRISAAMRDPSGTGVAAILHRAGLPVATHGVLRAALMASPESMAPRSAGPRLDRRALDRALAADSERDALDVDPLTTVLLGFAAEAARAEALSSARSLCEDWRLSAA